MISYSATALIIKDSEIALVKRASKPFKGYWALVGGRKEDNETYEQCIKREVLEETGLCVDHLEFLNSAHITNRYGKQFTKYYIVTPCSYDIKMQKEEIADVKWFPLRALPRHIVPFHRDIIEIFKVMTEK